MTTIKLSIERIRNNIDGLFILVKYPANIEPKNPPKPWAIMLVLNKSYVPVYSSFFPEAQIMAFTTVLIHPKLRLPIVIMLVNKIWLLVKSIKYTEIKLAEWRVPKMYIYGFFCNPKIE